MVDIPTLTHARIRAAQGDVSGARRVLRAILRRSPDNVEARSLLGELEGRAGSEAAPECVEALPPAEAAEPRSLAARFRRSLGRRRRTSDVPARVRRLRAWLTRIRGGRPGSC